jgi:3-isopropylmalate/(R)-2-methylmalate dehydratase small subunit
MEKFSRHSGIAAPLLQANIDTDSIIPSREMKAVSRHGLAAGLFAGWRYMSADSRVPNPDFILNRPEYEGTSILLGGDNFGCGSSREHAVWALQEYGIRVIIAPGFGSIFFNNCIGNGLLALKLPDDDVRTLAAALARGPKASPVSVDLDTGTVKSDSLEFSFSLAPSHHQMLREGLDPVDLTLQRQEAIMRFEAMDLKQRPWAHRSEPALESK